MARTLIPAKIQQQTQGANSWWLHIGFNHMKIWMMSKLSWLIKYAEGTKNLQKIMFPWLLIYNWYTRSYVLLLFIKCTKISDSCVDDKLKKHSLTCWRTMQGTPSQFNFMFARKKIQFATRKAKWTSETEEYLLYSKVIIIQGAILFFKSYPWVTYLLASFRSQHWKINHQYYWELSCWNINT
jgi:hypothetical protein